MREGHVIYPPASGIAAGRRATDRTGFINYAIGLLMLALIVPLALRATSPPPPTIAEFSPEARQIKEAPREQTGLGGGGQGGSGLGSSGGASASPSPLARLGTG